MTGAATTMIAAGVARSALADETAAPPPRRKFTVCLAPGMVGVRDDPAHAIDRATRFGFEAIEPSPTYIARVSDAQLQEYLGRMRDAKLSWGCAGLAVQFRGDDDAFRRDLQALPDRAKALQRVGATRMGTWLSPTSASLTYLANFRQHVKRLREVANLLNDHGIRLGLEYVGPKTSWTARRYPFVHTMAEMKDLMAEIDRPNVGLVLDTWHWYTAQESVEDLLTLRGPTVIQCHLNDAPTGITVDEQVDSRRALPCSTGVIDMKGFLTAMLKIGYDGPLVCEPFMPELRTKPADEALAIVAEAMKKAVALVE